MAAGKLASDGSGYLSLLAVVFMALAYVGGVLDLAFIMGTSPYWQAEQGDIAQYVSGFQMYFSAPWRFPLLAFDSLNYPEGTRVTFVDGIPVYALFLKLLVPSGFAPFNPFGIWVALCHVLQAVGAWWLSREAGVKSVVFPVGLTAVFLLYPAFMARVCHISLMSHWILLFALALYIRSYRLRRLAVRGWTLLLIFSVYINVYLFAMACGIYLAAFFAAGSRLTFRSALIFILPFAFVLGSFFFMLLPLPPGAVMREWGFGYYSMNLLAPFTGGTLFDLHVSVTPGQGEGFNYLGLGILMAFPAALWICAGRDGRFFLRHWPLGCLMLVFTVYALSSEVYFGGHHILSLRYPGFLAPVTSQFRASGRFFWPVGYCVMLFCFVMLYRRLPGKVFIAAVAGLVLVQYLDLEKRRDILQSSVHESPVRVMDRAAWDGLLGEKPRILYFYPKFRCGDDLHLTLLPVMRYASDRGHKLNTGYIARYFPDCGNIPEEIAGSPADAAYVFVRAVYGSTDAVEALFPGDSHVACTPLDFAFVCLRSLE